jgi:cystathionine beta-lyase
MVFNFDQRTNRRNTDSMRWDSYGKDVIPLWVADMDFECAPCITEALIDRIKHGVLGYTKAPKDFKNKIADYLEHHYQWQVDPEWVVILPSVVSGLYTAARQLSDSSQNILVPKPVYHHLKLAATDIGRDYTEVDPILDQDRWVLPFDRLNNYAKPNSKLFYLCNPQNPGGTVFSKEELSKLASFALEKGLTVISDEIHAGLVLDPNVRHIPIASLSPEISKSTLTLMSLNKTFNFPGTGLAWAVAENPAIREAIKADLHKTIAEPGLFSYVATAAAMEHGEPWRKALIEYLRDNLVLVQQAISEMPQLILHKTEATYLAWIDCNKLGIANPQELFLKHGVALSPGSQFGNSQFLRLNFGTQRATLIEALGRMKQALHSST